MKQCFEPSGRRHQSQCLGVIGSSSLGMWGEEFSLSCIFSSMKALNTGVMAWLAVLLHWAGHWVPVSIDALPTFEASLRL